MPTSPNHITLLLPDGLTPEGYHALTKGLVDGFAMRSHATSHPADRGYLVLSEMNEAPSENAAVLNDSTWTLSMPVPAGTNLKALAAAAKRLSGGSDIEIEIANQYRTSTSET